MVSIVYFGELAAVFIAFVVVQKFVDKVNSMNTVREKNIIATVIAHREQIR